MDPLARAAEWVRRPSPRLSGSVFVDRVHGVDSSASRSFGEFRDIERIDAMPHENSVFHAVQKHVPWDEFDRLVEEHGSDFRVRRLSTKSQFLALLYAQLSGASSLREVVGGLESHAARLYHLGAEPAKRSTLADANAHRPSEVFAALFSVMVAQAHRGLRRKLADTVYLIDATCVRLNGLAHWGRHAGTFFGAKVHVIYDPDADRPIYFAVTPANVLDLHAGKRMPIEAGATYVFDLGYYDYRWWAELHAKSCRIVTRFKSNTPLAVCEELAVAPGGDILSDRIGYLPQRQKASRRNPFHVPLREVRVKLQSGKVLRILCNDLAASAQEIADLYKRRWAVELFFRWVKQTLRITRFFGTSENAARIQIAVALIAFLLLRLAQATQSLIRSPLAFARLVRANLMHRRRIDCLLTPEPSPIVNHAQLAIQWN
jgi:hypothetical protein